MSTRITVRLDAKLYRMPHSECERTGCSRSEIIRDALRRHISYNEYIDLRRKVIPFAGASGYVTDEDIFIDVS